jgi:ElaB/YqjD/DUF883 family membrane-anchored ribosome-binding protein
MKTELTEAEKELIREEVRKVLEEEREKESKASYEKIREQVNKALTEAVKDFR